MKTVILAGGKGTRISEETLNLPKPMISIGGKPILWHIINYYSKFNFKDFIICAGYKLMSIKKYFINYKNVNVVDTGLNSQTGIRIKKIRNLIGNDDNFFMSYGDGLSNVDLKELTKIFLNNNCIGILTTVRPPARFGKIYIKGNRVTKFEEKNQLDEGWINGGYFIFNKKIFKYINNDKTNFETYSLKKLAKENNLMLKKHFEFWQCMDTLREKIILNNMYKKNNAPWLIKKELF